jgi:hypothetical protein
MAFKLNLPGNGTGAAPLPAGKSLENCAFRNRETTDFDCHGRELHLAGVPRLFTAHFFDSYRP